MGRDLVEEGVDPFEENIQGLYQSADTEGRGFITREEFIAVSVVTTHIATVLYIIMMHEVSTRDVICIEKTSTTWSPIKYAA